MSKGNRKQLIVACSHKYSSYILANFYWCGQVFMLAHFCAL